MIYKSRLKALREDANITQRELASIINIGHKGYSHIETEYTIISLERLNILCEYFNVSFDYIFGFSNERNYPNKRSNINTKLLSERLKCFRKEHKLTLMRLGDILKCSYGTLAGYESGRYLISTAILYDLCSIYGLSADYMLGKTDEERILTVN